MKVFFDTNFWIAESLLGKSARRMISATTRGKWRIFTSQYVLDEVAHVLVDELDFTPRLAAINQRRIARTCAMVRSHSRVEVPQDPKDSPILQAALSSGSDYLVTNDRHLLALHPFQSLQIIFPGWLLRTALTTRTD